MRRNGPTITAIILFFWPQTYWQFSAATTLVPTNVWDAASVEVRGDLRNKPPLVYPQNENAEPSPPQLPSSVQPQAYNYHQPSSADAQQIDPVPDESQNAQRGLNQQVGPIYPFQTSQNFPANRNATNDDGIYSTLPVFAPPHEEKIRKESLEIVPQPISVDPLMNNVINPVDPHPQSPLPINIPFSPKSSWSHEGLYPIHDQVNPNNAEAPSVILPWNRNTQFALPFPNHLLTHNYDSGIDDSQRSKGPTTDINNERLLNTFNGEERAFFTGQPQNGYYGGRGQKPPTSLPPPINNTEINTFPQHPKNDLQTQAQLSNVGTQHIISPPIPPYPLRFYQYQHNFNVSEKLNVQNQKIYGYNGPRNVVSHRIQQTPLFPVSIPLPPSTETGGFYIPSEDLGNRLPYLAPIIPMYPDYFGSAKQSPQPLFPSINLFPRGNGEISARRDLENTMPNTIQNNKFWHPRESTPSEFQEPNLSTTRRGNLFGNQGPTKGILGIFPMVRPVVVSVGEPSSTDPNPSSRLVSPKDSNDGSQRNDFKTENSGSTSDSVTKYQKGPDFKNVLPIFTNVGKTPLDLGQSPQAWITPFKIAEYLSLLPLARPSDSSRGVIDHGSRIYIPFNEQSRTPNAPQKPPYAPTWKATVSQNPSQETPKHLENSQYTQRVVDRPNNNSPTDDGSALNPDFNTDSGVLFNSPNYITRGHQTSKPGEFRKPEKESEIKRDQDVISLDRNQNYKVRKGDDVPSTSEDVLKDETEVDEMNPENEGSSNIESPYDIRSQTQYYPAEELGSSFNSGITSGSRYINDEEVKHISGTIKNGSSTSNVGETTAEEYGVPSIEEYVREKIKERINFELNAKFNNIKSNEAFSHLSPEELSFKLDETISSSTVEYDNNASSQLQKENYNKSSQNSNLQTIYPENTNLSYDGTHINTSGQRLVDISTDAKTFDNGEDETNSDKQSLLNKLRSEQHMPVQSVVDATTYKPLRFLKMKTPESSGMLEPHDIPSYYKQDGESLNEKLAKVEHQDPRTPSKIDTVVYPEITLLPADDKSEKSPIIVYDEEDLKDVIVQHVLEKPSVNKTTNQKQYIIKVEFPNYYTADDRLKISQTMMGQRIREKSSEPTQVSMKPLPYDNSQPVIENPTVYTAGRYMGDKTKPTEYEHEKLNKDWNESSKTTGGAPTKDQSGQQEKMFPVYNAKSSQSSPVPDSVYEKLGWGDETMDNEQYQPKSQLFTRNRQPESIALHQKKDYELSSDGKSLTMPGGIYSRDDIGATSRHILNQNRYTTTDTTERIEKDEYDPRHSSYIGALQTENSVSKNDDVLDRLSSETHPFSGQRGLNEETDEKNNVEKPRIQTKNELKISSITPSRVPPNTRIVPNVETSAQPDPSNPIFSSSSSFHQPDGNGMNRDSDIVYWKVREQNNVDHVPGGFTEKQNLLHISSGQASIDNDGPAKSKYSVDLLQPFIPDSPSTSGSDRNKSLPKTVDNEFKAASTERIFHSPHGGTSQTEDSEQGDTVIGHFSSKTQPYSGARDMYEDIKKGVTTEPWTSSWKSPDERKSTSDSTTVYQKVGEKTSTERGESIEKQNQLNITKNSSADKYARVNLKYNIDSSKQTETGLEQPNNMDSSSGSGSVRNTPFAETIYNEEGVSSSSKRDQYKVNVKFVSDNSKRRESQLSQKNISLENMNDADEPTTRPDGKKHDSYGQVGSHYLFYQQPNFIKPTEIPINQSDKPGAKPETNGVLHTGISDKLLHSKQNEYKNNEDAKNLLGMNIYDEDQRISLHHGASQTESSEDVLEQDDKLFGHQSGQRVLDEETDKGSNIGSESPIQTENNSTISLFDPSRRLANIRIAPNVESGTRPLPSNPIFSSSTSFQQPDANGMNKDLEGFSETSRIPSGIKSSTTRKYAQANSQNNTGMLTQEELGSKEPLNTNLSSIFGSDKNQSLSDTAHNVLKERVRSTTSRNQYKVNVKFMSGDSDRGKSKISQKETNRENMDDAYESSRKTLNRNYSDSDGQMSGQDLTYEHPKYIRTTSIPVDQNVYKNTEDTTNQYRLDGYDVDQKHTAFYGNLQTENSIGTLEQNKKELITHSYNGQRVLNEKIDKGANTEFESPTQTENKQQILSVTPSTEPITEYEEDPRDFQAKKKMPVEFHDQRLKEDKNWPLRKPEEISNKEYSDLNTENSKYRSRIKDQLVDTQHQYDTDWPEDFEGTNVNGKESSINSGRWPITNKDPNMVDNAVIQQAISGTGGTNTKQQNEKQETAQRRLSKSTTSVRYIETTDVPVEFERTTGNDVLSITADEESRTTMKYDDESMKYDPLHPELTILKQSKTSPERNLNGKVKGEDPTLVVRFDTDKADPMFDANYESKHPTLPFSSRSGSSTIQQKTDERTTQDAHVNYDKTTTDFYQTLNNGQLINQQQVQQTLTRPIQEQDSIYDQTPSMGSITNPSYRPPKVFSSITESTHQNSGQRLAESGIETTTELGRHEQHTENSQIHFYYASEDSSDSRKDPFNYLTIPYAHPIVIKHESKPISSYSELTPQSVTFSGHRTTSEYDEINGQKEPASVQVKAIDHQSPDDKTQLYSNLPSLNDPTEIEPLSLPDFIRQHSKEINFPSSKSSTDKYPEYTMLSTQPVNIKSDIASDVVTTGLYKEGPTPKSQSSPNQIIPDKYNDTKGRIESPYLASRNIVGSTSNYAEPIQESENAAANLQARWERLRASTEPIESLNQEIHRSDGLVPDLSATSAVTDLLGPSQSHEQQYYNGNSLEDYSAVNVNKAYERNNVRVENSETTKSQQFIKDPASFVDAGSKLLTQMNDDSTTNSRNRMHTQIRQNISSPNLLDQGVTNSSYRGDALNKYSESVDKDLNSSKTGVTLSSSSSEQEAPKHNIQNILNGLIMTQTGWKLRPHSQERFEIFDPKSNLNPSPYPRVPLTESYSTVIGNGFPDRNHSDQLDPYQTNVSGSPHKNAHVKTSETELDLSKTNTIVSSSTLQPEISTHVLKPDEKLQGLPNSKTNVYSGQRILDEETRGDSNSPSSILQPKSSISALEQNNKIQSHNTLKMRPYPEQRRNKDDTEQPDRTLIVDMHKDCKSETLPEQLVVVKIVGEPEREINYLPTASSFSTSKTQSSLDILELNGKGNVQLNSKSQMYSEQRTLGDKVDSENNSSIQVEGKPGGKPIEPSSKSQLTPREFETGTPYNNLNDPSSKIYIYSGRKTQREEVDVRSSQHAESSTQDTSSKIQVFSDPMTERKETVDGSSIRVESSVPNNKNNLDQQTATPGKVSANNSILHNGMSERDPGESIQKVSGSLSSSQSDSSSHVLGQGSKVVKDQSSKLETYSGQSTRGEEANKRYNLQSKLTNGNKHTLEVQSETTAKRERGETSQMVPSSSGGLQSESSIHAIDHNVPNESYYKERAIGEQREEGNDQLKETSSLKNRNQEMKSVTLGKSSASTSEPNDKLDGLRRDDNNLVSSPMGGLPAKSSLDILEQQDRLYHQGPDSRTKANSGQRTMEHVTDKGPDQGIDTSGLNNDNNSSRQSTKTGKPLGNNIISDGKSESGPIETVQTGIILERQNDRLKTSSSKTQLFSDQGTLGEKIGEESDLRVKTQNLNNDKLDVQLQISGKPSANTIEPNDKSDGHREGGSKLVSNPMSVLPAVSSVDILEPINDQVFLDPSSRIPAHSGQRTPGEETGEGSDMRMKSSSPTTIEPSGKSDGREGGSKLVSNPMSVLLAVSSVDTLEPNDRVYQDPSSRIPAHSGQKTLGEKNGEGSDLRIKSSGPNTIEPSGKSDGRREGGIKLISNPMSVLPAVSSVDILEPNDRVYQDPSSRIPAHSGQKTLGEKTGEVSFDHNKDKSDQQSEVNGKSSASNIITSSKVESGPIETVNKMLFSPSSTPKLKSTIDIPKNNSLSLKVPSSKTQAYSGQRILEVNVDERIYQTESTSIKKDEIERDSATAPVSNTDPNGKSESRNGEIVQLASISSSGSPINVLERQDSTLKNPSSRTRYSSPERFGEEDPKDKGSNLRVKSSTSNIVEPRDDLKSTTSGKPSSVGNVLNNTSENRPGETVQRVSSKVDGLQADSINIEEHNDKVLDPLSLETKNNVNSGERRLGEEGVKSSKPSSSSTKSEGGSEPLPGDRNIKGSPSTTQTEKFTHTLGKSDKVVSDQSSKTSGQTSIGGVDSNPSIMPSGQKKDASEASSVPGKSPYNGKTPVKGEATYLPIILPSSNKSNPSSITAEDLDTDALEYQRALRTLQNINSGNFKLFTAEYFIQLIQRCNCASLKFLIPILQKPNSGILVTS